MNFSLLKTAALVTLLGTTALFADNHKTDKEAPKAEEAKEAPKAEEAKEAPKAEEAKEAPKAEEAKEAPKAEEAKVDNTKDIKVMSYGHGFAVGSQIFDQIEFYDKEEFIKGLKAALNEKENKYTEEMVRTAYMKLEPEMRASYMKKQEEKKAADRAENLGKIQAFLKEKDLKKTESGLEYKVLKEGDGDQPAAADQVTVHYTGYLTDGTKFDSSVDRGEPATFPLSGVIKGWTEGVQLMKIGSKYRFKIPPELGYGARKSGPIPANSTLIFDIELISIKKAK